MKLRQIQKALYNLSEIEIPMSIASNKVLSSEKSMYRLCAFNRGETGIICLEEKGDPHDGEYEIVFVPDDANEVMEGYVINKKEGYVINKNELDVIHCPSIGLYQQ